MRQQLFLIGLSVLLGAGIHILSVASGRSAPVLDGVQAATIAPTIPFQEPCQGCQGEIAYLGPNPNLPWQYLTEFVAPPAHPEEYRYEENGTIVIQMWFTSLAMPDGGCHQAWPGAECQHDEPCIGLLSLFVYNQYPTGSNIDVHFVGNGGTQFGRDIPDQGIVFPAGMVAAGDMSAYIGCGSRREFNTYLHNHPQHPSGPYRVMTFVFECGTCA